MLGWLMMRTANPPVLMVRVYQAQVKWCRRSVKLMGGSCLSMTDSDWEDEGGINIAAVSCQNEYKLEYRKMCRIGKI